MIGRRRISRVSAIVVAALLGALVLGCASEAPASPAPASSTLEESAAESADAGEATVPAGATGAEAAATSGSATAAEAEAAATSGPAGAEEATAAANAPVGQTEPDATAASASTITLQVNGASLQMAPADTEAASALVELLRDGPMTVELHPYGGFEEVGPLPQALPTSDEQITTTAGDVMLYQGDQISIFLGSNTWDYTPLGHIEGATPESLLDIFGEEGATVELSL